MYKRNNKGFTMVEILAVIVILGILAGVAIPSVSRYIKKSRKQAYETMENSLYDGARNYVLDENLFLNKCSNGYSDIEGSENLLTKFQYVENLIDPADKSKQCDYKVYGCMENEQSMDALATYKYKVQIKCIDYENCAIYRDDGTRLPCEDVIDDTKGPDCGTYVSTNPSWSTVERASIEISCIPSASGKCAQQTYSKIFTEEEATNTIEISDIFGNKTLCPVNVYIDRTTPSKPVINNPYEGIWTNKSYSIKISSVDNVSGIKYFEYRYPNSSIDSEREWARWESSSKEAGDSTEFETSKFSLERNEYVEVRACDYAGNCSETTQSMIMIDKTAPTCSISLSGTGGTDAIYTSEVTVTLNTNNTG